MTFLFNKRIITSLVKKAVDTLDSFIFSILLKHTIKNNQRTVTNINDNWLYKEKFPGNLISDGTSKENVKNPDVIFE